MAKIERLEDINAWQKARELVKDCGPKDQIRRASISVVSNIAEGLNYPRLC